MDQISSVHQTLNDWLLVASKARMRITCALFPSPVTGVSTKIAPVPAAASAWISGCLLKSASSNSLPRIQRHAYHGYSNGIFHGKVALSLFAWGKDMCICVYASYTVYMSLYMSVWSSSWMEPWLNMTKQFAYMHSTSYKLVEETMRYNTLRIKQVSSWWFLSKHVQES